MRIEPIVPLLACMLPLPMALAQGTVPTFRYTAAHATYTLMGSDPGRGGVTTIPTLLVPIALSFEGKETADRPLVMDAAPDVPLLLRSPLFSEFAFPFGGATQYADALLRTTFPKARDWHTLLAKPEVKPLSIAVPAGYGYVLTSRKAGRSLAVVDIEFLQKQIFRQIPKQPGKLVVAITHNTTYYVLGDATVCCSWGTHGVDSASGNSFVLGSYLDAAPPIVEDRDVQPLTQQLAEFVNDPLHDPLFQGRDAEAPGNRFPPWMRPASMPSGDQGRCGGSGAASRYFLLEPTNTNPKNNIPASRAFTAHAGGTTYHLENVALLPWYTGKLEGESGTYSYPDPQALPEAAAPCPVRDRRADAENDLQPSTAAVPWNGPPNGHQLIGYWTGYGNARSNFTLRKVSPQWDVIIVAFATPDHSAPEGTLQFRTPDGFDTTQFKADIAYVQRQGKRVLISLGGGGQLFSLAGPNSTSNFVSSVTRIVSEYGFDGIDLDFETPSLDLDPGDTDFRHPVTPSTVHVISALRQLHDHFGTRFMISLVPEGTQIPGGYPSYGGQFGSYIPIAYAIRDILSFMDVQDYNTPPLEGLDGEIYQAGTVDYHAAMTELALRGFAVGGDPKLVFPPLLADQVAAGFLTGDTNPEIVSQAMSYIITGKVPAGATYKLRSTTGYPRMLGAMFWTINDDRRNNYDYSNVVGPLLHGYH